MPLGEFELGDGGSIWAGLDGGGERRRLSASALRRRFDGRWRATGHREDETGSSSFRTLPQHKSLRPVLVGFGGGGGDRRQKGPFVFGSVPMF